MFWKRTTSAAAITGLISGLLIVIVFNNFAPSWFGKETLLYTAYLNGAGQYEIPFMVNMGWSFAFTVLIMVLVSLAGPRVNPKAFELDQDMFKLKPSTIALITIILMTVLALYVKFW
jgi:SSS family solute:Na+ symporter